MKQDGATPGSLVLSVDFPARHENANGVASELLRLLHQHRVNATWATDDFRGSLVREIVSAREEHEIALLSSFRDSAQQPARQVEQELARAQSEASQVGLSIQTVALVNQDAAEYARLVSKYQFRMVRGRSDCPTNSLKHAQPTILRYGLWLAPISHSLGDVERWTIRSPLTRARRAVKRIARNGGAMHVGIDLGRLDSARGSGWDNLRRLLTEVSENSEQIESLSLRQAAIKFGCHHQESARSRSILRAA